MSEVDLNQKDPEYMANVAMTKDEFIELLNILKKHGCLGPVPHIRATRFLEQVNDEVIE